MSKKPVKPPARLGFKSNSRNPTRMSHGSVKKYHGGEELRRPPTGGMKKN